MIWLVLAALAAGFSTAAWALASCGPWVVAVAVLALWIAARLAAAVAGRRWAGGAGDAAAGATPRPDRAAVGRHSSELELARTPADVAAATLQAVAGSSPGATAELWLLDETGAWSRPDGTPLGGSPPGDSLARRLAQRGGPMQRAELATLGDAAARLAADGHGQWVLPLAYGGGLLGLVWADGPPGLDRLLASLRRPTEEALGHTPLVRRVAEQREVAEDIELGAAVQRAFIPDRATHAAGGIEVAGSYMPASRCGGDWWAVHDLGGGASLVLIADVTGHGVGAARITAAATGAHELAVQIAGRDLELPRLFQALDAAVRRVGAGHYHMTCFAAIFDGSRRVSFAGAGHVAPYRCRVGADGSVAIDALVARGNPLGIARALAVQVSEQALAPGDLLLFYSDGLIDCTNPARERLGDRRMQRLLRQVAAERLPVDQVRDRVDRLVIDFAAGTELADDITFAAVGIT